MLIHLRQNMMLFNFRPNVMLYHVRPNVMLKHEKYVIENKNVSKRKTYNFRIRTIRRQLKKLKSKLSRKCHCKVKYQKRR